MKIEINTGVPVYVKTDKNMEWPSDKLFYILSSDGLFQCRNHDWFTSCTKAKNGPSELEAQETFAHIHYPKIPKAIIESAVGFFRRIEKDKQWESALILVWNRLAKQYELVCPEQKASGGAVEYDIPPLPSHVSVMGDIHSHCNFSPSPSITDENDEEFRPGLHIVAGYIMRKPEFYCCVVIDGKRFEQKNHSQVMEAYEDSNMGAVPQDWIDKVKKKTWEWSSGPTKEDERTCEKMLAGFWEGMERGVQPMSVAELRSELFSATKRASYNWCEDQAEKFLKKWNKHAKQQDKAQAALAE